MRNVLVLLAIIWWVPGVAQQSPYFEQIRAELNSYKESDTARVNKLNDLALAALPLIEREEYLSQAISLAKKLNYAKGESIALTSLWWIKLASGKTASADSLYPLVDAAAIKSGDKEAATYLKMRQSFKQLNLDNDNSAIESSLEATHLLEEMKLIRPLYLSLQTLAVYYDLRVSNYPAALEYYMKALQVAEQHNLKVEEIQSLAGLGGLYATIGDRENALPYLQKALEKNKVVQIVSFENSIQNNLGEMYRLTGAYPEAIEAYNKSLKLAQNDNQRFINISNLADVYLKMGDVPRGYKMAMEAYNLSKGVSSYNRIWADIVVGRAYLKKQMADSAIYVAKQGLKTSVESGNLEFMRDNAEVLSGGYKLKDDFKNAYNYHVQFVNYRDSMLGAEVRNKTALLQYNNDLEKKQSQITQLHQKQNAQRIFLISAAIVIIMVLVTAVLLFRNNRQKQKANALLKKQKQEIDRKADELSVQKTNIELLGEIGKKITSCLSVERIISTAYDNVNKLMDASVFGIGIYNEQLKRLDYPATYENGEALPFYTNEIGDANRFGSVCFSQGKEIIIGNLDEEHKHHVQEVQTPHEGGQPISIIFLPLTAKDKKLGVITVQSFRHHAYSDYHLYMLRNIAIYTAIALENAESYEELNHTVANLKSAQAQLIHSEKMASLGELTAGIAHEIQNPLNFVNNFSEINMELIDELQQEIGTGNISEALQIGEDIKGNLGKISHHGKRADAIVKSMLQHSRKSAGEKEPTDINALVDEYLRLSYHGLRAKDKTFNCLLETHFDPAVGKINAIGQDLGRVLLNLFNNAFYACAERSRITATERQLGVKVNYDPTVQVSSKMIAGVGVEIKVTDNGTGIPETVLEKIYQPFFTTKPAGEGTGLGLSLSYDIITKGHGGKMRVETTEGEGTTFELLIPAS